jgi:hypothetical protein
MKVKRYMPDKDLPDYAFLPGRSIHPNKPGGHMFGKKDPIASPIDLDHPEVNEVLRYSLDLFNLEYFWESHVYLEALWNTHQRKGHIADFFKGIIMLAASGVKLKMGQPVPAVGHLERALELFISIEVSNSELFLGFELSSIIEQVKSEISRHKGQEIGELSLSIYPLW